MYVHKPSTTSKFGQKTQDVSTAAQTHIQLKKSLRGQSFDEQVAALSPVQRKGGDGASGVQAAAAQGVSGGGGTLPYADKIQAAFGNHDISNIQAYQGGNAAGACNAIGAEAYATGTSVAFKGAPTLHTAAHEAAHIVQQRAGVSLKGGVGKAGDQYEQHADAVADLVVQGKSAESMLDQYTGAGATTAVQRTPQEGPSIAMGVESDSISLTDEEFNEVIDRHEREELSEAVRELQRQATQFRIRLDSMDSRIGEFVRYHNGSSVADFWTSWFADKLGGAELPEQSFRDNAHTAQGRFEVAAAGDDLQQMATICGTAEYHINQYIIECLNYIQRFETGLDRSIATLEFTKTVSFTIVTAYLSAGQSASVALAINVGGAAVDNAATQIGEISAGLRPDFSMTDLGLAVTKSTVGQVLAGAAGQAVATRVSPYIVQRLGGRVTSEMVEGVLAGSFGGGFQQAFNDTWDVVEAHRRGEQIDMTADDFLRHLATGLIAGGIGGALGVDRGRSAPATTEAGRQAEQTIAIGDALSTTVPQHMVDNHPETMREGIGLEP